MKTSALSPKGFVVYRQGLNSALLLPDESAGRVFKAAARCFLEGIEPEEPGGFDCAEKIVFDLLRDNIDMSVDRYRETCARKRKNASAPSQAETADNDPSPVESTDNDPSQVETTGDDSSPVMMIADDSHLIEKNIKEKEKNIKEQNKKEKNRKEKREYGGEAAHTRLRRAWMERGVLFPFAPKAGDLHPPLRGGDFIHRRCSREGGSLCRAPCTPGAQSPAHSAAGACPSGSRRRNGAQIPC